MPSGFCTLSAKVDLDPLPKINRVPPLIIHNLHVKFESDWAKTVVFTVPTRFYTCSQRAKVDLDLWPYDPKSLGFLSSWTTYRRRLKVIQWNSSLYHVHKGMRNGQTHSCTHSLTQPHTNGHITISPPTLLRGDKNILFFFKFLTTCPLSSKNAEAIQCSSCMYMYYILVIVICQEWSLLDIVQGSTNLEN